MDGHDDDADDKVCSTGALQQRGGSPAGKAGHAHTHWSHPHSLVTPTLTSPKSTSPAVLLSLLATKASMKPTAPKKRDPSMKARWTCGGGAGVLQQGGGGGEGGEGGTWNHSPLGSAGLIHVAKKMAVTASTGQDRIMRMPWAWSSWRRSGVEEDTSVGIMRAGLKSMRRPLTLGMPALEMACLEKPELAPLAASCPAPKMM